MDPEQNASALGSDYWEYEWSDNGQKSIFEVREQLYNASGTIEERYDEINKHQ